MPNVKILLVGGTAWPSTEEYYSLINRQVNARLGGSHSFRGIIESLDFAIIEEMLLRHDYASIRMILATIVKEHEKHIAGYALLSNTMHAVAADYLRERFPKTPLIHISEAVAARIKYKQRKLPIKKVGFLGTRESTESESLLRAYLQQEINICLPNRADQQTIDDLIFGSLVKSTQYKPEYSEALVRVLRHLQDSDDIDAFILGCTELDLALSEEVYEEAQLSLYPTGSGMSAPVRFDSTLIHAQKIASRYCKLSARQILFC